MVLSHSFWGDLIAFSLLHVWGPFWGGKKSGLRDCWEIEGYKRDLSFPTDFLPEHEWPALLSLPCIYLRRKAGSDLPLWMVVRRKACITKMLSSALPIEYVTLMQPDIQLVAQGGCRCSLSHHRSSLMMSLKCSWGRRALLPKQTSRACGILSA